MGKTGEKKMVKDRKNFAEVLGMEKEREGEGEVERGRRRGGRERQRE